MLVVYFAYAAACLTSHFLMSWNFSRVSTLIEYFSMFTSICTGCRRAGDTIIRKTKTTYVGKFSCYEQTLGIGVGLERTRRYVGPEMQSP